MTFISSRLFDFSSSSFFYIKYLLIYFYFPSEQMILYFFSIIYFIRYRTSTTNIGTILIDYCIISVVNLVDTNLLRRLIEVKDGKKIKKPKKKKRRNVEYRRGRPNYEVSCSPKLVFFTIDAHSQQFVSVIGRYFVTFSFTNNVHSRMTK